MLPLKKKKKVDYEALNSALMRIPRMDVAVARNFIDIGIREIYELQGRAPEVLFEEAKRKNDAIPDDRIRYELLRLPQPRWKRRSGPRGRFFLHR